MKWWGVAVVLTALVGALLVSAAPDDAQASRLAACRSIAEASQARHRAVVGEGITVAVIGDSYAMGTGLDDPSTSWPSRLDGRIVVDGFAGSGFSAAASRCDDVAFPARVRSALGSNPDLVVVQGGLNDFDVPSAEIRTGVRAVIRLLEGREAVLVGPPVAPRRAKAVSRIDALVSEVAAEAGVPYVPTSSWELDYLDDRLHLSAAGHVAFGDAVASELALRRFVGDERDAVDRLRRKGAGGADQPGVSGAAV